MDAHICVCICTYKRPDLLRGLLRAVLGQRTDGRFSFSIVVADNDSAQSARSVIDEFSSGPDVRITYGVELEQNIAKARNKALELAIGDYLAFIDDDEIPGNDWLLSALDACSRLASDGVLGPVRPLYNGAPPEWLIRGRFFERPEPDTGHVLRWRETRTGNVLMKRDIVLGLGEPFRPSFGNGGEDQDFFRRLIERGHVFAWCNEMAVMEHVPAERCTRSYLLRRALQRGQCERDLTDARGIAKSLLAVPLYSLVLPFAQIAGHHHFMSYLVRLCDHAGKLMGVLGFRPVGEKYVQAA